MRLRFAYLCKKDHSRLGLLLASLSPGAGMCKLHIRPGGQFGPRVEAMIAAGRFTGANQAVFRVFCR